MSDIVVVDDDPGTERLFRKFFSDETWGMRFFTDQDEALTYLRDHPCSLVLLDIVMPGMGGLDLLYRIKHDHAETTCIMVTAIDDRPTIRAAMQGGAFDYITKPIDFHDLRRTIFKALEHAHLIRTMRVQRDSILNYLRASLKITTNTLKTLNAAYRRRTERIARDGEDTERSRRHST